MNDGTVASFGTKDARWSGPFKCRVCDALGSIRYRDAIIAEFNFSCDPMSICKGIVATRLWAVDIRSPSVIDLFQGTLLITGPLPSPTEPGPVGIGGAIRGAVGDGGHRRRPWVASQIFMAAQACGSGSEAGQVALEFLRCICLRRTPRVKFEESLGPGVDSMDRAQAYGRKVAEATDNGLPRTLAQERD